MRKVEAGEEKKAQLIAPRPVKVWDLT